MSILEEYAARYRRPASVMIIDGTPPSDDPFASKFGCVSAALEGEEWPMLNGSPMVPFCQINCAELPLVPLELRGIGFIAIFISNSRGDEFPMSCDPAGKGWQVRVYPSGQALAALSFPQLEERPVSIWKRIFPTMPLEFKPSAIQWELEDDYPDLMDVETLSPEMYAYFEDHDQEYEDECRNISDSKVGGWPTFTQAQIFYGCTPAPVYVLQFGNEEDVDLFWGDLGIASFGVVKKDGADTWFMDTNFT